ncbi:hypothetical protein Esti_003780 [Eimeria stiedai]
MEASIEEANFAGAYQEPQNAEAVRRVMLLLSQSNIKQHLECQVRYYLSWKLLSRQSGELPPMGNWPPVHTGEAAQQHTPECFNGVQTSPKLRHSLAFKATVALILDWLRAHSLIHAADVLCPEAALRETEVMSQQECLAVLRLPQCLLGDQTSSVTSAEQDSSLLDRLVTFAAKGPATAPAREKSHNGFDCRLKVQPMSLSATESAEGLCSLTSLASRRVVPTGATSEGGRPLLRSPAKKLSQESAVTRNCDISRQPYRQFVRIEKEGGGEYKVLGFEEEAKTQLLLLAAKIRELELHNSSEQLFTAIDAVKQGVNQRLASIDAKHTARIRRLQKAMKHDIMCHAYKRAPSGLQENEDKLLQRRNLQNVAGATSSHQAEDEMFGVVVSAGRGELPLAKMPVELSNSTRMMKCVVNKMLAKENASLRLQLVTLRKHAALLQKQLQKYDISYEEEPHPPVKGTQAFQKSVDHQMTRRKPSSAPFTPADAGKQAIKEEYEGRVAQLTQELQAKANQMQAKDADFRFLVGELESARQKSAQVHRKARRLQKLYEAAKAARAQQRRLAASVSLSLKRLVLAEAPSAEHDDGEVFATDTTVKASSNFDEVHHVLDLKKSPTLETSSDPSLATENYQVGTGCSTQRGCCDPHQVVLDANVVQPAHGKVKQSSPQSQHHRTRQSSLERSCAVVLKSCSSKPVQRADAKNSYGKVGLLTDTRQLGEVTKFRAPTYMKSPPSIPGESMPNCSVSGTTYSQTDPAVNPFEVVCVKGRPIKFLSAPAHLLAEFCASPVKRAMTIFEPTVDWRHFKQTLVRSQPNPSESIGKNSKNAESHRTEVLDSVAAAYLPFCVNTVHCQIHGEDKRDASADADSRAQLTFSPCKENPSQFSQEHPAVPRVTGLARHGLAAQQKEKAAEAHQSVNSTMQTNVFPRIGACSFVQCTHEVDAATEIQPVSQAVASPCAITQRAERLSAHPGTSSTQRNSQKLAGPLACSHGDANSSGSLSGDSGEVRRNQSQHEKSPRVDGRESTLSNAGALCWSRL